MTSIPVSALSKGTVIDHIKAGCGLKILSLLKFAHGDCLMTVGLNLKSGSLGKKDLIKIEGVHLSEEEGHKIAIFSPSVTLNLIDNFKVVKKFQVEVPSVIENVFVCPNEACITRSERVQSAFHVIPSPKRTALKCSYCEKQFFHDQMESFS